GAKDYKDALAKSILFYDAQRSGKLPANNPIPWRGDSALKDCVVGGWYDAGDHVKFGLPLSSAATVLSWSLVKYKDAYVASGQLDNMFDMIKWAYDYFLAAWNAQKQELVVQVGDGDLDHKFWGRPEDMTMNRPCYTVNKTKPGSDVASGTAAALAAGSIAYKDNGDASYAAKLLDAAKSLYSFAKSNRGVFEGQAYYTDTADNDEMCEGAMWLYKATNDNQYLEDAKSYSDLEVAWGYGWENKMVGCQALIYEATKNESYRDVLERHFTEVWFPGGDVDYSPCGFAWRTKWGSARHTANTAFIALIVADLGIIPDQTRKWAVEQINYLLGDNSHDGGCFSYEIGYGSKYPLRPHHRAASCPTPPASCEGALDSPAPSPHVLNGALVGGPEADDSYTDIRTDYVLNEVALDYNSGFQGALSGIIHLQLTNKLPATDNKCPCKE
ncbi:unnamed protein product, partial [Candidula unifasciata]